MQPTEVMMLGRLQPDLRVDFLNPPRTSPSFPQNLMRQTVMNGVGRIAVNPDMVRAVPGPGPMTVGQLPYRRGTRHRAAPFVGALGAAQLVTPAIGPGTAQLTVAPASGRFMLPSVGPGQFRLFGLGQGNDAPGYQLSTEAKVGLGLLSSASGAASAWHGYRRNRSVLWAAVWGLSGLMFPIITPAVGLAQGWGKRKGRR